MTWGPSSKCLRLPLAGVWPAAQWPVYLRSTLSGAGLLAIAMLDATEQANYEVVKKVLVATYQVTSETYRKLVFGQTLDIANPDDWLRMHRQNFRQWFRMSDKAPEELVLMETIYQKKYPDGQKPPCAISTQGHLRNSLRPPSGTWEINGNRKKLTRSEPRVGSTKGRKPSVIGVEKKVTSKGIAGLSSTGPIVV